MNALAHKLHEIAIVLENEATFHERYKACAGESPARARTVIVAFANRFAVAPATVLSAPRIDGPANREHLRRYFDDIYDIKGRTGSSGFLDLPPFAFWEDSVKNTDPGKLKAPTAKPAHQYYVTQSGLKACDEYVKQLAKADAAIANGDKDEHVKLLNQPDVVDLKTMSAQINAHISIAQGHIDKVEAELLKARIMSNKAAIIEITTKTLVNGKDIKDFEDSEIYDLIAAQEAEIARLEAIKTKPKKLLTEIAKRQEGIAALVAYLDSKE